MIYAKVEPFAPLLLAPPSHEGTPMNMHERFAATELMVSSAGEPSQPSWLGLLGVRLASWVRTCADHYAAAAAYDDLSRLSDTQLEHRGLSRDILARDVSGWRREASGS